jgi:hypothetical protein
MMKDPERKVTVEDLLRLKRAERPPQEFWERFESEIRAKQLAAIVIRRPWWDGASRIFAVALRNRLPFGAAAAIALTWAGVHYAGGPAGPARSARPVASSPGPVARAGAPASQVPAPAAQSREEVENAATGTAAREAARSPGQVVAQIASHLAEAPPASKAEAAKGTQFADGVAADFVDFRGTDPDLARRDVFGSDREFEASFASVHQPPAEPLARMDPSGERLERLLVPALPSDSSSGATLLGAYRIKQKASYDRMYESLDRYGAGGMSLEFRF